MSRELFDDDFDPLAPPAESDERVLVEEPDRFGPGAEPEDAEFELGHVDDGGVGDRDGIVRLWFTDDGSLAKVRLSPVWFRKLDSGAKLADVFRQVVAIHKVRSVRVAAVQPEERPVTTLVDVPKYTPEHAAIIHAMIEHNLARMGEAAAALDAQGPPAAPKPATAVIVPRGSESDSRATPSVTSDWHSWLPTRQRALVTPSGAVTVTW